MVPSSKRSLELLDDVGGFFTVLPVAQDVRVTVGFADGMIDVRPRHVGDAHQTLCRLSCSASGRVYAGLLPFSCGLSRASVARKEGRESDWSVANRSFQQLDVFQLPLQHKNVFTSRGPRRTAPRKAEQSRAKLILKTERNRTEQNIKCRSFEIFDEKCVFMTAPSGTPTSPYEVIFNMAETRPHQLPSITSFIIHHPGHDSSIGEDMGMDGTPVRQNTGSRCMCGRLVNVLRQEMQKEHAEAR